MRGKLIYYTDYGHSCYIGRWLNLVMLSVVFSKDKGLV